MDVEGTVRVLGALEKIRIDPPPGQLSASVAVDHVDIKRLAGFESFLPGAGLDEVARMVRASSGPDPGPRDPVEVEPQIAFRRSPPGPCGWRARPCTSPSACAGRGRRERPAVDHDHLEAWRRITKTADAASRPRTPRRKAPGERPRIALLVAWASAAGGCSRRAAATVNGGAAAGDRPPDEVSATSSASKIGRWSRRTPGSTACPTTP